MARIFSKTRCFSTAFQKQNIANVERNPNALMNEVQDSVRAFQVKRAELNHLPMVLTLDQQKLAEEFANRSDSLLGKIKNIYHGRVPKTLNVTTFNTVIETLEKASQVEEAIQFIDKARQRGCYKKVFVSDSIVDIRGLSPAVARSISQYFLRDLREKRRPVCDIKLVTGQKIGENGVTLSTMIRNHFKEISGPQLNQIHKNPGCFNILSSNIQWWLDKKRSRPNKIFSRRDSPERPQFQQRL